MINSKYLVEINLFTFEIALKLPFFGKSNCKF